MMDTFSVEGQDEKLELVRRFQMCSVCIVSVASLTMLSQLITLPICITARWRYQWLLADGFSQIIFLGALVWVMCLLPSLPAQTKENKYLPVNAGSPRNSFGFSPDDLDRTVLADEDPWDDEGIDDDFWSATATYAKDSQQDP